MTVPDSQSLHLTSGMTVEAWPKPLTLNSWETAVMKEASGQSFSYALYANTLTNTPSGYTGSSRVQGSAALAVNAWTHVAVTFDGTTVHLYVNGTQASTVNSGNIPTSTGALRIGGNATWGEYFSGVIDEARVDNTALSATHIQADMAAPITTTPADTTPPTVSMTAPANNATLTGTVNLAATASDDTGVAGVQFQLDGSPIGPEQTTAPYTLAWDSSTTSTAPTT